MAVRWLEPDARVEAERGGVVVCVVAASESERLTECLQALARHTPTQIPILVCGADVHVPADIADEREVMLVGGDFNAALRMSAPADVALVRADCLVAEGWLSGLRDAAYVDTRVATASALPARELRPAAERGRFEQAAAAVRGGSLRLRPRVVRPSQPCRFVRRSALELVGKFDDAFWERCVERGLCHVLADDVLVWSDEGGAPIDALAVSAPLARSVAAARRAVHGLSVLIDARVLSGPMNGTQRHVLELIAALTRASPPVRLSAIVPADLSHPARVALQALPGIELTTLGGAGAIGADIVHRPFQISSPADLTALAGVAERLVVTHQDLISYHNPSYFRSAGAWEGYRRLTQTALAVADRVVFVSAHARDDALAEDLVEPHRASVVHHGVDHTATGLSGIKADPPAGVAELPDSEEMILCLGTDFQHKNRLFALAILEQLRRRHGWRGRLVFAGPRAAIGSSAQDEREMLARDPDLTHAVIDLDAVSEAEKHWLLGRASLVLYPTVHEGFGFVPFEAAQCGTPCLWARGTALSEILPEDAAGIEPWDVEASALRALELMREERLRDANLQAIDSAAQALRWDRAAERLIAVYRATCDGPPAPAAARERLEGLMGAGLSEDAMRLVGPDGLLPRELERPLLALASHSRLGGPVFGAIKAGYDASYRWRRRRR